MTSLPSITGGDAAERHAASFDSYVQPALGHGLRIWWALYWRSNLISVLLVFALGLATEILVESGAITPQGRLNILNWSRYVFIYAATFFILHRVLQKRFRGFRVRLTPEGDPGGSEELPATRERTTRIWWTYTWRTTIYGLILSFAGNIPLGALLFAAGAVSPKLVPIVQMLEGMVVNGAAGLFVIYSNILDEDIGGFRVGLASNEAPAAGITTDQGAARPA